MVKRGRFPGGGGMAGFTTGAKRAGMWVIGGMTGITSLRRAFEQSLGRVTFGAERIEVRAGQREGRVIVIKRGRLPTGGGMTVLAGGALRSGMEILALMTTEASCWRVVKFKGGRVALITGQIAMRARQGKDRAVIKGGRFPTGGCVAGFTGRTFPAGVPIIPLMTAKAGGGRSLKCAI
jgi:hypothetical protein